MHFTLENLLNGETHVPEAYQLAHEAWREFFDTHREAPVGEWAGWLWEKQIVFFEHQCGGRNLGQEVMAWSGFAYLYTVAEGFGENMRLAEKLASAFAKSMCSVEVKGYAKRAAASYGVEPR